MKEYTNNNYLTYEQVKDLIQIMESNQIKARVIQGGIGIYPSDEKQFRLMLELALFQSVELVDSVGHRQSLLGDIDSKIRQDNIQHLNSSFDIG